jgi:hypothetical protein
MGVCSGTYTTVGSVCSSSLLRRLIDLDVLDDQVASIQTLRVGVRLSVLQETEKESGGLGGPAGAGDTKLLACRSQTPSDCFSLDIRMASPKRHLRQAVIDVAPVQLCCQPPLPNATVTSGIHTLGTSASAAGISSHGDSLLLLLDVLEELDRALELPAVDGLGGFSGVLEGDSEVRAAGLGRFARMDARRGVSVTLM